MADEVLVPAAFIGIVDEVQALIRRSHEAGVSFSQAIAEAEDRFLNPEEPPTAGQLSTVKEMDLPILRGLTESRGTSPSWRLDVDSVRSWWRGDPRLAVISDRQLTEAIAWTAQTQNGSDVDDAVFALGETAIAGAYSTRLKASE